MIRSVLLVSALLIASVSSVSAQNLCAQVAASITAKPGQVLTVAQELPEHAAVFPAGAIGAGEPMVTGYEVGFFPANQSGAAPIGTAVILSKTAMTTAPPGVNCYTFQTPPVPVLPFGDYIVGTRAKRTATAALPAADGPWGFTTNPFVLAPPVPAALGRSTILK